MKKTLLATALIVFATVSSASAAEMSLKAPPSAATTYDWSGFYLGADGGYGWGTSFGTSHLVNQPLAFGGTTFDLGGFLSGLRAGYNLQVNRIVIGGEVDLSGTNIQISGGTTPGNYIIDRINWLSTARGRIGYILGETMLFGASGFSMGGLQQTRMQLPGGSNGVVTVPPGTMETATATFKSWTIGGGIEIRPFRNWSLTGEYLYLPFSAEFITPITQVVSDRSFPVQTVRVGVDYNFGGH